MQDESTSSAPTQRCTTCGCDFPATPEYFHTCHSAALRRECKTCVRAKKTTRLAARSVWTAAEQDLLRANVGLETDEIALRLGRSERAVRSYASRAGIALGEGTRRSKKKWSAADDAWLHEYGPASSIADCCSTLGCSKGAVTQHARSLGVGFYHQKGWHGAVGTAELGLWRNAKSRAKRFGLPFTIDIKDCAVPDLCPVLGIPLKRATNAYQRGAAQESPTLDRLIPSLGYIKGNVAVISWRANRLKSDASAAELRAVADWVGRVTTSPR